MLEQQDQPALGKVQQVEDHQDDHVRKQDQKRDAQQEGEAFMIDTEFAEPVTHPQGYLL